MTDEPIVQEAPEAVLADKPGGIKGFFATTVGKIVIIGGAVGALAAIVAIVAFLLLSTFVTTSGTAPETAVPAVPAATSTVSASGVSTTPPVADIQNRDVFTPRNPFEPVLAPASAFRDPDGGTTRGTSRGTLLLSKIINDNGVLKADLFLGSTEYVLGQGESIPGTPWLVYRIRSNSVTMQYGDDYLTLWPGGGITK